jgi:hypothetical protein
MPLYEPVNLPAPPVLANKPKADAEGSMPRSSKPRTVHNDQEPPQVAGDNNITTLMIRNIPSCLTQSELVKGLDDSGFKGLYDFAYLPTNMSGIRNKGFAFINMLSAEAAGNLVGQWQRQRPFNMERGQPFLNLCQAKVQGLEANLKKVLATSRQNSSADGLPFVVGEHAQILKTMLEQRTSWDK